MVLSGGSVPAPQAMGIFPLGEAHSQVHTQAQAAVVIVVTRATSILGAVHSLLSVLQASGQLSWQRLVLAAFPHCLTLFVKEGKIKKTQNQMAPSICNAIHNVLKAEKKSVAQNDSTPCTFPLADNSI